MTGRIIGITARITEAGMKNLDSLLSEMTINYLGKYEEEVVYVFDWRAVPVNTEIAKQEPPLEEGEVLFYIMGNVFV